MKSDLAIEAIREKGGSAYLGSFSALDRYFGIEEGPSRFLQTDLSLQGLAGAFAELRYPGLEFADASVTIEGGLFYLSCVDAVDKGFAHSFKPLELLYDDARRVYLDPHDIYKSLRAKDALFPRDANSYRGLFEAAILVSRYHYEVAPGAMGSYAGGMPKEAQATLLCQMITGAFPWKGLSLLRSSGFIDSEWPEIATMEGMSHSKEEHPEGDVWEHTLETFRYRKIPDLRLSLGLLLHDSGKPEAEPNEGRRFDRHAELGERVARSFLSRLGINEDTIQAVCFLVRNHMLPSGLPRLPLFRVHSALESPLFPLLLELFRCDLFSTWTGPDSYYEACRAYRAYLRNVKNPYRSADGKKFLRLLEVK